MLTDERLFDLWSRESYARYTEAHKAFARAVEAEARAQERERCAQIADEHRGPIEMYNKCYPALMACAAAIRALA